MRCNGKCAQSRPTITPTAGCYGRVFWPYHEHDSLGIRSTGAEELPYYANECDPKSRSDNKEVPQLYVLYSLVAMVPNIRSGHFPV
jgi:hypothetical protein